MLPKHPWDADMGNREQDYIHWKTKGDRGSKQIAPCLWDYLGGYFIQIVTLL